MYDDDVRIVFGKLRDQFLIPYPFCPEAASQVVPNVRDATVRSNQ